MNSNYEKLMLDNLNSLYEDLPDSMDGSLPARKEGDAFFFMAFGEDCCLEPHVISIQRNTISILEGFADYSLRPEGVIYSQVMIIS